MFLHREVLKQSWQVIWRNKYLWFFGFFAVIFTGQSGLEIAMRGLGIETNSTSSWIDFKMLSKTGIFRLESVKNIFKLLVQEPFSMLMVLFIVLLIVFLILFVVWLSNVSQIAIVNNTFLIKEKKETSFQQGVSVGMQKFWPVFTLNIVKKVLIFLIFVIITLPLTLSAGATNIVPGNIVFSVLFVILVPVVIALAFIVNFAIAYVVIRQESFNRAIRHAIRLFNKNWLVSIEMGFLLYFIGLLVTIAVILIVLMLVFPFIVLGYFATSVVESVGLFSLVLVLAFLIFSTLVVLAGSLLSSFQNAVNAIFFMKLVGEGASSKIVRVFDKKHS